MKTESPWPKKPTTWMEDSTLYVSVPFTWNMPALRKELQRKSFLYDHVVIGGPGVYLTLHYYPGYLAGLPVEVKESYLGVLQRVNPQATRTTTGCVRRCRFCGVGEGLIEGGCFYELEDWPDTPILADNNLLAASEAHFDKVIDRLKVHGWADFNQGLDARLLTEHHARRIAEIKEPKVRLALDSPAGKPQWEAAYDRLRSAGIAKHNIRSYALIGFDSDPTEAWERCKWIESFGVKPLPMWFHRLDALRKNLVTPEQDALGWNDYERRRIMQWFYQHKEAVK